MSIKKRINWYKKVIKTEIALAQNPNKKYKTDKTFRLNVDYTKFIHELKIEENVVLYEAYHGQSMTGNPYAVFKNLISNPKYKNLKHVWVVNDAEYIHPEYRNKSNISFVERETLEYAKHLATAKYLINDTTFPPFFQRREGQVYANIWHGTPLKNMGVDIKNRNLTDHKNIQHNFLYTDYMVSPNKFTYETMLKSHDVHNIYSGNVVDTGYPRVDLMFNANKEEIRKKLSVPEGKKVVLYAPTWRGVLSGKVNMSEQLLEQMNQIKNNIGDEYVVLLKSHYYAYNFFEEQGLAHLCVPNSMDTNEVLSIVDILITDYSSIFFDFLPSRNPIIYFAYDYEEYENNRGMYIKMTELPGPLCTEIDEVIHHLNNINDVKKTYQSKYDEFVNEYCYHDDGNATERFLDIVFEGKESKDCFKVETNKTKILIYCGGFLNNGITSSVTNLLNNIDYDRFDVTAVDYGDNNKVEKKQNIAKLNPNVKVIYRVGTWNASKSEWHRHLQFLNRGAYSERMKKIVPEEMYRREFKRLVGDATFDVGIDFSGYSPFWSSVLAFGDLKKRVIYQHNDMIEQANKVVNKKFPHKKNLRSVFSLYTYYDKVVSVSKLTLDQNIKSFANIIDNYKERMDFVINNINYNQALSMKDKLETMDFNDQTYFISKNECTDLNLEIKGFELPKKENINFINIGRLEPEKDQEKLLLAFSEIAQEKENVRLYLVGQGELRGALVKLVKSLDLEEKVIFTGQISNPYALLNLCDCFVLSSNHEGQPMVLLETLILGKPIIVTNIPGSRSVVEGGYGLIVDNSVEGVTEGLEHFINGGQMSEKEFDYIEYSKYAMQMFYDKVCL